MADAIPVHSEPKRKPAVKPAPVDNNGVPMPGDYIAQVRDGLGSPSDFNQPAAATRELTTAMDVIEVVDGKSVVVSKTHNFTREDF